MARAREINRAEIAVAEIETAGIEPCKSTAGTFLPGQITTGSDRLAQIGFFDIAVLSQRRHRFVMSKRFERHCR